jgi:hypothetical protein
MIQKSGALFVFKKGKKISKFFLEMAPLGVKTCEESEFDILKEKKRLPDSGKAWVFKRKVVKMRFLRLFASIHRPFLNQGSISSLRKCQTRISHMFLPLEGSFPEKILKIFSRGWFPLYFVIDLI